MNFPPPHRRDYDTSVFINCPFDDDFRDYRQAITLTVIAHGFWPVCGLDVADQHAPRLYKLIKLVVTAQYSIHDFTRCRGEGGDDNLARFNMPLELGMALMENYRAQGNDYTLTPRREHQYMVLVPDRHSYKEFVSDLSGYDFTDYKAEIQSVVGSVLRWLRTRDNCLSTPTTREVMDVWARFVPKRDAELKKYPDRDDLPQDILLGLMVGLCARRKWWHWPSWLNT